MDVQTRHDTSRTVEDRVKLLVSANRKSYMQRRLAQQRVTFRPNGIAHYLCGS